MIQLFILVSDYTFISIFNYSSGIVIWDYDIIFTAVGRLEILVRVSKEKKLPIWQSITLASYNPMAATACSGGCWGKDGYGGGGKGEGENSSGRMTVFAALDCPKLALGQNVFLNRLVFDDRPVSSLPETAACIKCHL